MSAKSLVAYARRSQSFSQRELAERSGVGQPLIARIEAGRVVPLLSTLENLLHACGLRLTIEERRGNGVDRTAMLELLALTPEERLRRAAEEGRNLERFEAGIAR
jgi:predicted transcriptional regulator